MSMVRPRIGENMRDGTRTETMLTQIGPVATGGSPGS